MKREMLPTTPDTFPWTQQHHAATWAGAGGVAHPQNAGIAAMASADATMVESQWYHSSINHPPNHQEATVGDIGFPSNADENFLMQPLDSSSCAPSFTFFDVNGNNPFHNAFDFGPNPFHETQSSDSLALMDFPPQIDTLELISSDTEFPPATTQLGGGGFGRMGVGQDFDGAGSSNAVIGNEANAALRPPEILPPSSGAPPTLFEKRSMLRRCSGGRVDKLEALEISVPPRRFSGFAAAGLEKRVKILEEEEEEEDLENYDSDDDEVVEIDKPPEENNGGAGGGNQMGKRKRMPAKNLMAERRRRKKLNDRLYMLRSVVPRISKMDRASILGDAIEYLKELQQRVNDLHNELESSPTGGSPLPPPSSSFRPLTLTPATLPCRVNEELCPSSSPSPKSQSAKVEVRAREGRGVNIHMFCSRRPGLLLSTMRALDNLGLDVHQAVISCFNGFALDVFRAEQCSEGEDVVPEKIKAVLLNVAGFPGMM